MNFQAVVMNVADLNQSIDFYREVLGFTILSREDELATVRASGSDRNQVIVLRAIGSGPRMGARHIGLRALVLEADSADQLERIASEFDSRGVLATRRDHSEWTAVVGRDPDWVTVVVAWHPSGGSTTEEGWRVPDDFLYGIGE